MNRRIRANRLAQALHVGYSPGTICRGSFMKVSGPADIGSKALHSRRDGPLADQRRGGGVLVVEFLFMSSPLGLSGSGGVAGWLRPGGPAGSTPVSRCGGEFCRERLAGWARNSSKPRGRSAGERQLTAARKGRARQAACVDPVGSRRSHSAVADGLPKVRARRRRREAAGTREAALTVGIVVDGLRARRLGAPRR
jgi:hypothetical protein